MIQRMITPFLAALLLFAVGCSSDSKPPCSNPTAAQCLDDDYCADCEARGVDIETVCSNTLAAHYNASSRELALVPELSGSEDTLRERYDVSYADQPFLFMPTPVTPPTFYQRFSTFKLLTINDSLQARTTRLPLLPDLEFNPVRTITRRTTSKGLPIKAQLPMPQMSLNPDFMFEDLSYDRSMIEDYLDALYSGKVGEWNENGSKVESCEEYAYEKFHDFSLFKDFLALHDEDPLRVVEYAFRGSRLDANGIYVDEQTTLPGSIGTKFMTTFALKNLPTTLSDVIQRKGGEPRSIFEEKTLNYWFNPTYGYSAFYNGASPDISVDVYWDHAFSQNQARLLCGYPSPECIQMPDYDFMPKNFFVEVLGRINAANTDRKEGIVLSDPDLLGMMGTDLMAGAMNAYDNSFKYHFLMLDAARRQYPNERTLNNKFLEFKLLRKHLIQLLAERARYETYSFIFQGTFSQRLLTQSETLPPSEKDYAAMKLDESVNPAPAIRSGASKGSPFVEIIIDPVLIVSVLQSLDEQIEALLLEARTKGCLAIDPWDDSAHDYPTVANDGETIDLSYDKALCDWTPEMFTTAAVSLIPDAYYENVYTDCMRVTGGDFEGMAPNHFRFAFPSACEDNSLFAVWSPNTYKDYTDSTVSFHMFETLVKKYPEALLDCDTIIQGQTKKELAEADMNFYDPVTGRVLMSKSRSYYEGIGGQYAGLEFGYALGWLYEGYDEIPGIQTQGIDSRDFVCSQTGFFAFGNYFAGGSFLGRDFTLCSAGSYASNKTSGASRPEPPTLAAPENAERINTDMATVADETGVHTTYFIFIKNEKMTYSYANDQFTQTPVSTLQSPPYSGDNLIWQSVPPTQMLSVNAEKSVPICGIISVTIRGSITGDIDATTTINTDKRTTYLVDGDDSCKNLNFSFTPEMYFDAFAQASVTAGIAGVASVSAGVEVGLRVIGIRFPYTTELSITQNHGTADDRTFNYDIFVNAYNNLDQEITLLSGYFGAFVKIEYLIGSDTYRQSLFSWDGIRFTGNLDRLGTNNDGVITPFAVPVKALYGLSNTLYQ